MNYIVYSHTDYLPILKIQTEYNKGLGHRTLFINAGLNPNTEIEVMDVICQYDRIVYYDDSKPYATRLLECLSSISDEYFILLHDFDILLNVNTHAMDTFHRFLSDNKFDRIDLKHTPNLQSSMIVDVGLKQNNNLVYLVRAEDPHDYIYNVNPSIWRRESLVEMLSNFPDSNYRDIECHVQKFCTKYNVFKMHCASFLNCGWFLCLEIFKYLHITHHGQVLPLNPPYYMTPSRQSYADVAKEYEEMCRMYGVQDIKLKHYLG